MTVYFTPMILGLGPQELIIILIIILLLFGGSRLAGLGKSTGRALKEFKEETKGLSDKDKADEVPPTSTPAQQVYPPTQVTQTTDPAQTYPPVPPQNQAGPSASDLRRDV